MPELEAKIAAWKARLAAELTQGEGSDAVRELESHLRDAIEAQLGAGISAARAFDEAARSIGDMRSLALEYRAEHSRWFAGADSREMKLMAYLAGVLGVLGFVVFAGAAVRGGVQLAGLKRLPDNMWLAVVLEGYLTTMSAICLLAVRAARGVLVAPCINYVRTVIAFNLLAVWLLAGNRLFELRVPFELRTALVGGVFLGLVALWWVWLSRIAPGGPTERATED